MERDSIFDIVDERWKIEHIFSESGQGACAIVHDNQNSNKYVIKVLKNISKRNLIRFEQEISILKKCDAISGIPRIIEANLEKHYYVMEWIQGKTLDEALAPKKYKRNFNIYMSIIMNLLQIVMEYSRIGIVHRDIKPLNIICLDEDVTNVFLLDFGTSFDEMSSKDITMVGEELGNRFLHISELQSGNKRDIRSDITFCVGIFFFMLTGSKPVNLMVDGLKPHEKVENIIKMQWLGSERLQIINKIFDKGFSLEPNERFQTVEDLIFALNELNKIDQWAYPKDNLTDSYTLTTMNQLAKKLKNSRIMEQELSKYAGKEIGIGRASLHSVGDMYKIQLENNNEYLKIMESIYNRHNVLNDLIVVDSKKNNKKISDSLDKNEFFEVTNRIRVEAGNVRFDNFKVRNSRYEIPLKNVLQSIFYKQVDVDNILNIEYENNNILIYYTTGIIEIFNLNTCEEEYIESAITEVYRLRISSDHNWIMGISNSGKIILKRHGEAGYEDASLQYIGNLHNIIDFFFNLESDLVIVLTNRISIWHLDSKTENIIWSSNYINSIEYVSLNKRFLIVSCGRIMKKRILVNINEKSYIQIDSYCNIVENSEDKLYLDKIDYPMRSIIHIDNLTGELKNTIVRENGEYNTIRICRNFYFKIMDSEECKRIYYGVLGEKNKEWVMKTYRYINKIILHKNGIVTLLQNGDFTIWKLNI